MLKSWGICLVAIFILAGCVARISEDIDMSTRSAREYQASKGIGVGPGRSRSGGLGGGGSVGGDFPDHFSDAREDPSSRGPGRSNPDAGGTKHPDDALQEMNAVNQPPLTEVQKALIESSRQRRMQKPGLDIASTILGAMPAPGLAAAFTLGQAMGEASEEEAAANPDKFTTNPKDPGSVYSTSGPKYSNRAEYPGHSTSTNSKRGQTDERNLGGDPFESRRRKKTTEDVTTTILGASPVDLLGPVVRIT